MMAVRTLRHVSTPNNSNGKWRGKSINENRVWSGRANNNGGCRSFGNTCTWKTSDVKDVFKIEFGCT